MSKAHENASCTGARKVVGMPALLIFASLLLIAVLVSELARRSVLSTSVLFLGGGIAASLLGWIRVSASAPVVLHLAEYALVAILFTDGIKTGWKDLKRVWMLPGRALFLGLPLTLLGTAVLARWLLDVRWADAFLVGAALSPTDPVLAAALVGNEAVPSRLRHLLNVESGLNDGLALPIVIVLLSSVGAPSVAPGKLVASLGAGLLLGVLIPLSALELLRMRIFAASSFFRPLLGFSILLLVYSLSRMVGANFFLGAFSAGLMVGSLSEELGTSFGGFGEYLGELLKLAALLIFGAVSVRFLGGIPIEEYIFALLALIFVRPVAILLSLIGARMSWTERLTAAWFGPKGFASVIFGLLILNARLAESQQLFRDIALVVIGSIVLHSSTDILATRQFLRIARKEEEEERAEALGKERRAG